MNTCKHLKEVGCIKDVCSCNTGPKFRDSFENTINIISAANSMFGMSKQETLEDIIYQNIGLAANEQGIINQALAASNVMKVLQEKMYTENDLIDCWKASSTTSISNESLRVHFNIWFKQFKKEKL